MDYQAEIKKLTAVFLHRDPRPVLQESPEGILFQFLGVSMTLYPLGMQDYKIVETVATSPRFKAYLDRHGLESEQVVNTADLLRFVVEKSAPAKMAQHKFLLPDKRSRPHPHPQSLEIQEFRPYFEVGPVYYGIIDTTNMSWLKGHEYARVKDAERALKECQSGKLRLEYRGF